jgi:hypothetical protein
MNQLSIVLNKHIIKDTWATSSRMTCSSLRMSVFFHKKKKKIGKPFHYHCVLHDKSSIFINNSMHLEYHQ